MRETTLSDLSDSNIVGGYGTLLTDVAQWGEAYHIFGWYSKSLKLIVDRTFLFGYTTLTDFSSRSKLLTYSLVSNILTSSSVSNIPTNSHQWVTLDVLCSNIIKDNWVKFLPNTMQWPTFLEPEWFYFWKTRFETYVKSKDIDLWEVIINGDIVFTILDSEN